MDLQLCLDFFAVITYISDYYSKDDSGTMGYIKEALKKAENESLKTKLSIVTHQFLTHRQIGECEAYFKILPHLHMKWSNIETVFIPTGFKSNRSSFLKAITEKEAKTVENVIKVKDKTGLYIEKPSMLDKFERIDAEKNIHLGDLTYLQFGIKYTPTKTEPKPYELISIVYNRNDPQWEITDELDLIVTEDFEYTDFRYSLPKIIQLKYTRPGEPKYMRKRKRQVARLHKINQTKNPHEFYYSQLQLYSKFSKESDLEPDDFDKCMKLYEQKSTHNNKLKINNVKSILMKHLECVEEGTERAEEILKSNVGDTLDPALEQDNLECEEIGAIDHPDFVFKDPTEFYEKDESRRYKSIELFDEDTLDAMTRELDNDQRLVLDIGVNFARSIIKARKAKDFQVRPPFLIVQGGAGSGKSHVIETLTQQMEKILRTSGDNPDHPYIIKCAFTGTAAANIRGQTLHNAFTFNFGNQFFSLGDKARDDRRTQLENLKIVIIDEFSMVKADMLYMLDLRLREVMLEPYIEFGNVAIFLFGDILQLRPVKSRYIFEEPSNEAFQLSFLTDPLWENFEVVTLRQNHRQGEDKLYADILNRARVGELTQEDIDQLESRVRSVNHPDIPYESLVISCTNFEVNRINDDKLSFLEGKEYLNEAIIQTRLLKSVKPRTDPSGAISGTPLQKSLRLKIGAKVMLTYNIDTCDGLTNGAFGEVVGYNLDENGKMKQVYVEFHDEECGKERRKNYANLQIKFAGKNVTPIDLLEFQYSLSKKANNFNSTAIAVQIPLKLAFSATAHKVQGLTVKKPNSLVVDLRSVREAAQAYVILSRVQALSQLFILDSFCSDKIFACPKAIVELQRLETVALNLKPKQNNVLISCNIRSMKKHLLDLISSSFTEEANVLCLQETWLDPSESEDDALKTLGWKHHCNSVGKGKGIASFFKSNYEVVKDVSRPEYQMTKLESISLDIINVYRSKGASSVQFLKDLYELHNHEKETLIVGDFNICHVMEREHEVFKALEDIEFKQLVKHATHVEGRLLDCVFLFSPDKIHSYDVKQQSPHFTDHDMIRVDTGTL